MGGLNSIAILVLLTTLHDDVRSSDVEQRSLHIPEKIIGSVMDYVNNHKYKPTNSGIQIQGSTQGSFVQYPQEHRPSHHGSLLPEQSFPLMQQHNPPTQQGYQPLSPQFNPTQNIQGYPQYQSQFQAQDHLNIYPQSVGNYQLPMSSTSGSNYHPPGNYVTQGNYGSATQGQLQGQYQSVYAPILGSQPTGSNQGQSQAQYQGGYPVSLVPYGPQVGGMYQGQSQGQYQSGYPTSLGQFVTQSGGTQQGQSQGQSQVQFAQIPSGQYSGNYQVNTGQQGGNIPGPTCVCQTWTKPQPNDIAHPSKKESVQQETPSTT